MTIAIRGRPVRFRSRDATHALRWPVAADGLSLPSGEHALVGEIADDEARYIGTQSALYHRGADESAWQRLAWIDVSRAEYRRDRHVLILHRWPGAGEPPTALAMRARSRLASFARERITACQILLRHVDLDGVSVVITLRREPGTDTTIWTAHLDGHHPERDPEFTAAAARLINEVRAQAGC